MNTIDIIMFESPMMNIGFGFLVIVIFVQLVRWVLDIIL